LAFPEFDLGSFDRCRTDASLLQGEMIGPKSTEVETKFIERAESSSEKYHRQSH
jgi:hypothetical protein